MWLRSVLKSQSITEMSPCVKTFGKHRKVQACWCSPERKRQSPRELLRKRLWWLLMPMQVSGIVAWWSPGKVSTHVNNDGETWRWVTGSEFWVVLCYWTSIPDMNWTKQTPRSRTGWFRSVLVRGFGLAKRVVRVKWKGWLRALSAMSLTPSSRRISHLSYRRLRGAGIRVGYRVMRWIDCAVKPIGR